MENTINIKEEYQKIIDSAKDEGWLTIHVKQEQALAEFVNIYKCVWESMKLLRFPKQVYVEIITDSGDGTTWMQNEKDPRDFNYEEKSKKSLGVYELKKVITAEQVISFETSEQ